MSLRSITSIPKNTPAIGALNAADIAAPAPAVVYMTISFLLKLNFWLM